MPSIALPLIQGTLPSSFVYSTSQPTKYTEQLSLYCLVLFKTLRDNGAYLEIENVTPETQQTAMDTYLSEFRSWLLSVSESVTARLLDEGGERGVFLVPLAPALPAVILGAKAIGWGLIIKCVTDTASNIFTVVQKMQAERRLIHVSRQFDKAFFDDGWFSAPTSKIDRLIDIIRDSGLARVSTTDNPDTEYTYEDIILDVEKMQKEIKVLSHVVVNSSGGIEGVDFGIAGDFGVA